MNSLVLNELPERDPTARVNDLTKLEQHYLGVLSIITSPGLNCEILLTNILSSSDNEFESPGWKALKERYLSLGLVRQAPDNMIDIPEQTWNWAHERIDEL